MVSHIDLLFRINDRWIIYNLISASQLDSRVTNEYLLEFLILYDSTVALELVSSAPPPYPIRRLEAIRCKFNKLSDVNHSSL